MKRMLLTAFLVLAAGLAAASERKIDPNLLQELAASLQGDSHVSFARTVAANEDLSKLLLDPEKTRLLDKHFSHKIEGQSITDQQSTGRCWMFAGLNILRSRAAKKLNAKDIEFSQNYLFFYDKLEKSNLFLNAVERTLERPWDDRMIEFLMKNTAEDGGQWVGLAELIKKYGLVPREAMPETYASSHSGAMNRVLSIILKKAALAMRSEKSAARREALRLETLKSVYKVLAVNLGTPPQTFSFRFEDKNKKIVRTADCTPLSFFRDFVGENLDDYFVCYSIPNRAFYRLYEVELDKAVDEGPSMRFINLPIAELKELGRKSVLGNDPVWFGCDVGKDSYGKSGLMIPEIYNYEAVYDIDLSMSRLETFLAYSNVPTHAMVFTGIDIENGKISKWLVENSWGKDFGNDGHYYMADDWFDQFVQMIVIHRKYLPQKLLEIFTTDPELLPPWDPMYKRVN